MIKKKVMSEVVVCLAPVHLKSAEAIRDAFSVRRETVRKWYRQGAPIAFDGQTYSAEYNALQAWRVTNDRGDYSTESGRVSGA